METTLRNKKLSSKAREIVYNILKFTQQEANENKLTVDLNKVQERVAAMTGVSLGTMKSIAEECPEIDGGSKTTATITQVEEKDDALFHEIIHSDIENEIVKEEQRLAEYFLKCEICLENFDSGSECVHLKYVGTDNLKQEDILDIRFQEDKLQVSFDAVDVDINNLTEEVKPKVENPECSSADKQDDSDIKLIDAVITVKQEEYDDSSHYLPINEDFLGCETGQTKTEDDIDIFYENIKNETIKSEPPDYEVSLNSEMLVQDKDSKEDIKLDSFNESLEDCTTQQYRPIQADKTDEAAFQCKVCSTPLSTKNNFTKHKNTNTCEGCLKSLNNPSSSETQVLMHSTKGWCTLCYYRGHLARHDGSHIKDNLFYCKVCSKSFSTGAKLVKHELIHTGEKPYNCQVCSNYFLTEYQLVQHQTIHAGQKPVDCKVSSKSFSVARSTLVNHERVHSDKGLERKFCSKSYRTKPNHVKHELIHAGEKRFQCDACSKSFFTKHHLVEHQRIHTGQKPFDCKVCSKSFSSRALLVQHQRIYTRDTRFECKVCSKLYCNRSSLVIHEQTHTEEKSFPCSVCPKSFVNKANLIRHQLIHTTEKPCVCKVCSKSFRNRNQLVQHDRIHNVAKTPFVCKICSKSFRQNSYLLCHVRTHTGEKPYVCKVCSKSFTFRSSLGKHERIHTGEKPFHCSVCSKSFKQSDALLYHKRINHPEKNQVLLDD